MRHDNQVNVGHVMEIENLIEWGQSKAIIKRTIDQLVSEIKGLEDALTWRPLIDGKLPTVEEAGGDQVFVIDESGRVGAAHRDSEYGWMNYGGLFDFDEIVGWLTVPKYEVPE